MHPTLTRELVMARQQDQLRSAASRRLVAEAKNARSTASPSQHSPLGALAAQFVRISRPRNIFRVRPA